VSIFRRRERPPKPEPVRWVKVAFSRYPPEAEMLANMLAELEIPVIVRRATMDVPDMLAGGPRELLVPADRELEARALIDPMEPIDDGAGDPPRGAPESSG
jgi:Putative prokaryotic signal transducing protein